jgi:hypothetical protein
MPRNVYNSASIVQRKVKNLTCCQLEDEVIDIQCIENLYEALTSI